jgi:hypothetical protein
MRRVKIVVLGGLALIVTGVLLVLARSPLTVAATNISGSSTPPTTLDATTSSASACQAEETLPARTSALRLALEATTGPRVTIEIFAAGTRMVTRGTRSPGWYGSSVTVPVRPLKQTVTGAKVCFQVSELTGLVALLGIRTGPAHAATTQGRSLPGRMGIAYLRPSGRSWFSRAGRVLEHMGLGRAWSGSWIVGPIAALAAAAVGLASWTAVRELR